MYVKNIHVGLYIVTEVEKNVTMEMVVYVRNDRMGGFIGKKKYEEVFEGIWGKGEVNIVLS